MIVVDEAVLARLARDPNLKVHDGLVVVRKDPARPVIYDYPLPYINFMSSVGDDDNRRLAGRRTRRSVFFALTYVGIDRQQTKAAGERARALLERWVPIIEGHVAWPCKLEESQRVRRDDDAVRPDGSPLFYGVDNYSVSITMTAIPAV